MNRADILTIEGTDPYTPARLLDIATLWDVILNEKRADASAHPVVDISHARYRRDQAFGIAAYMEREGIAERRNIGCFQLDFVKPGQKVILRKGKAFRTMHPSQKGPAKKDRAILVYRCDEGYTHDLENPHTALVSGPNIVWTGTGGYWCYANLDDVEIVKAEDGSQPLRN